MNTFDEELEEDDTAYIKEIYDTEHAQDIFEIELERALHVGCKMIVIEPSKLCDEITKWIWTGKMVAKIGLLCGFGAFYAGTYSYRPSWLPLPFGMTSLMCAGLYFSTWFLDPCNKYRIDRPGHHHRLLRGSSKSHPDPSHPVVLVRRENHRVTFFLQLAVATTAFTYSIWKCQLIRPEIRVSV